jgi:hypothetical protein
VQSNPVPTAHTLAIPELKIGTSDEPFPIGVFVCCYALSQDEPENRGRMHSELPNCITRGDNFHRPNLRLLVAQQSTGEYGVLDWM